MTGKKVDQSHAEIRDALRLLGYVVEDMSAVGHGYPDLNVGDKHGRIVLLEVKSDKGHKTPRQVDFFKRWEGYPVHVVRSVEDALEVLG